MSLRDSNYSAEATRPILDKAEPHDLLRLHALIEEAVDSRMVLRSFERLLEDAKRRDDIGAVVALDADLHTARDNNHEKEQQVLRFMDAIESRVVGTVEMRK